MFESVGDEPHPGPIDTGPPLILGLGGTTRSGSSGEKALRYALGHVQRAGGRTELLTAHDVDLPMFDPAVQAVPPAVARVLDAVQRADGIIIATPTYHAGISGLMKNVLDHLEHLGRATPQYLEGKLIGCIVTGPGSQGGAMTLSALRAVVHALRGWPTPLGVIVDPTGFRPNGEPVSELTATQLMTMAEQVMSAPAALPTSSAPPITHTT